MVISIRLALAVLLFVSSTSAALAQPVEPAADRSSADIFLAGALSTASNAQTIYAWDIKFTYPKLVREIRETGHWLSVSPRVEFTANKGTDANPDRVLLGGNQEIDFFTADTVGKYLPNIVWVNVAGAEFDRLLQTKNFTYQSLARLAFKTLGHPGSVNAQGVEGPPFAFLPRLEVGFETGTNVKNRLQSDGSGTIARLYLGATAFQDFGLGWLTFSMSYQLRKPFNEEVFFHKARPGSGESDELGVGKDVRQYIELSPIIKVGGGYFSLRPTYRRGSLPPAFTFVDNEFSLSIQVAAKAKRK